MNQTIQTIQTTDYPLFKPTIFLKDIGSTSLTFRDPLVLKTVDTGTTYGDIMIITIFAVTIIALLIYGKYFRNEKV